MRVLIIEDEPMARSRLESMLRTIDPNIRVLATLGSVKESTAYLQAHDPPDVAFVDIQLSDDHSFEIFRKVPVAFPVIFTTAYDRYLLESFEHNAIAYLLKPFSEEKLRQALSRLRRLEQYFVQGNIRKILENKRDNDRMVARKGAEFIALAHDDIAYFFTVHKIVFVRDRRGRQFILDKSLADLEASLDPSRFFRINRKYVTHISAIEKFRPDNGRIRIFLAPAVQEDVFISKETAPLFRRWVAGSG